MPTISANVIQDAFGPLIKVFEAILVFIHTNITPSWGLSIIGLTIVVRAALVPLTLKQFSSMAKLQALGPELKVLQARHKDDKQRLNEEMMKFYKENEVNPFGSCLPLVLQLPVFLSLFYMLRLDLKQHICGAALKSHHIVTESAIAKQSCGSIDPHSGKFLFIPDVTTNSTGSVLAVLIVLYIGSQLVSSLLTTATVDRNQRILMLALPFVFSIFIRGFPAGLIVYWITTNLWTVGQQYIVRRRAAPILPVAAVATAGGGGGSGSGRKGQIKAAADRPAPQGLMARLAATRDAALSAVGNPNNASSGAKAGGGRAGSAQAGGAKDGNAKPGGAAGRGPRGVSKTPAGGAKAGAASRGEANEPASGPPARKASRARGASAGAAGTTGDPAAASPASPRAKPSGGPDPDAPRAPRPAKTAASRPGKAAAARAGSVKAPRSQGTGKPGTETDATSAKDESAAPRARGTAPPPPPRKKKKRSGRRR